MRCHRQSHLQMRTLTQAETKRIRPTTLDNDAADDATPANQGYVSINSSPASAASLQCLEKFTA